MMKKLTLILAIAFLLVACAPTPQVYVSAADGRQCIQPGLDTIPAKLPWGPRDDEQWMRVRRKPIPQWMAPQFNWFQRMKISDVAYSIDMAIEENLIWMAYDGFITRYDISTQKIKIYDFKQQDPSLRIDDILTTKDHNLFIAGAHLSKDESYVVLLRYNTEKDTFNVVEDGNDVLQSVVGSEDRFLRVGQSNVLKESPNGNILFVLRGAIYSYNVSTNNVTVVFSNPELIVATIETDPRGMIWFTVWDDDPVWKMDPNTNELQRFDLPPLYSGTLNSTDEKYSEDGYALYLDSYYRLWIPAWGYLDTSKQEFSWHLLKPSLLFVNLYAREFEYTWDTGYAFEGRDGSIWFTSANGIIHYDMETQDACWISPEFGPIAETPDGTLWIMLLSQLYKYEP